MSEEINQFSVSFTVTEEICPCGSGKKTKKCCNIKPRKVEINFDPANFFQSDGLVINLNEHSVSRLVGDETLSMIGDSKLSIDYEREKGLKKLVEIPTSLEASFSVKSLFTEYDAICFVDTNTKSIGGEKVSVVAAHYVLMGDSPLEIEKEEYLYFEFRDTEEKPEILGWIIALKEFILRDEVSFERVALVVDSELDKHEAFNKADVPLLGDFFLPENITIVYSSADTASNLVNKAMKECDKVATIIMKKIESNYSREGLGPFEGWPFKLGRNWLAEVDESIYL